MGVGVAQFEVYVVGLDPMVGSEMRKTRPCAVVSPDEMNEFLRTVIVAPMTTGGREYPTRPACNFGAAEDTSRWTRSERSTTHGLAVPLAA